MQGAIANSTVSKLRSTGGIVTAEDLASYKADVQESLQGSYRGRKVYTTHAPTSGPVVLHILNLLEQYDLVKEGRTALNVHRLIEALKCESILGWFLLNQSTHGLLQLALLLGMVTILVRLLVPDRLLASGRRYAIPLFCPTPHK